MKNNNNLIELKAQSVRFFSKNDENLFFSWLKSLESFLNYKGEGRVLYFHINLPELDDDGLRELISLFYRYKIEMSQLSVFNIKKFSDWFSKSNNYWHDHVFLSDSDDNKQ